MQIVNEQLFFIKKTPLHMLSRYFSTKNNKKEKKSLWLYFIFIISSIKDSVNIHIVNNSFKGLRYKT